MATCEGQIVNSARVHVMVLSACSRKCVVSELGCPEKGAVLNTALELVVPVIS